MTVNGPTAAEGPVSIATDKRHLCVKNLICHEITRRQVRTIASPHNGTMRFIAPSYVVIVYSIPP
ncbi:hypothetical protein M514_09756 [Trichuris suis]|uniref:Uncharacterized protein n=1 Tax=Trichuris suis TaxID=68888 RepID=A0A085N4Z4_9BILA|nr:hypothetical protein M513_09756 [Trichuris suis]KFD64540.1 hypothetical protein M514_09756 [Trichuris suis]